MTAQARGHTSGGGWGTETLEGNCQGTETVVGSEGRGKHANSLPESLGCTAISLGDLEQVSAALCNTVSKISAFIQSSNIH